MFIRFNFIFMQRITLLIISIFFTGFVFAQNDEGYVNELKAYQKKYVAEHEVVKKKDKKHFKFFPVSTTYNISSTFERITDTIGFTMTTSANTLKHYYKYGMLHFNVAGDHCHLFVYQSKDLMQTEKYKDYLFVPFTDATNGDETYGSGRYLEFNIQDINNKTLKLDFNKAYNPYCAYSPDYKCPIPPKENSLKVAIKAGEMNFGKAY